MTSPDAKAARERTDALLRAQDWASVQAQVLRFAISRCKSKDLAQDLVQEALRKVFDPRHTSWDAEKQPSVANHLMGIVRSLLANERRGHRRHPSVPMDDRSDEEHDLADRRAVTEAAYVATDLHARRTALLGDHLRKKGDAGALRVLACMENEGLDEPGEIAEALGLSRPEVVYARRRLFRAAATVAELLSGEVDLDSSEEDQ